MASTEYGDLDKKVSGTLRSLKDKNRFLEEQRTYYIQLRETVISLHTKSNADDDDNAQEQDSGTVFGEVILGKTKNYISIGYEYYVEKSIEEVLEFVEDRLRDVEDAIKQFELQIKEAERVQKQLQTDLTEVLKSKNEDGAISGNDDGTNEEGLPFMEIVEEIDDEGNVIRGTVAPSARGNSEPKSETTEPSTHIVNPTSEVTEKKAAVAAKDMYTFAHLVQKLDEQDALEDGVEDNDNVDYDYDSMDNYRYFQSEEDDDEDDEDEDDDLMYGTMPGQSSFMQQLNKLRQSRVATDVAQTKSIFKPVEQVEELDKPKKSESDDKKKKKKKSVGFAPALDIIEVENVKDMTRENTHRFASIPMPDIMESDGGNADFDPDLFAQLLGVQKPEEVHEQYHNQMDQDLKRENEEAEAKRKPRVSRFKQARAALKQPEPAKTTTIAEFPDGTNDDMDKMARDYIRGGYEDERDQDPGMTIEHVTDFAAHNRAAEELAAEVEAFRMETGSEAGQVAENQDDDDNRAMLSDVVEKEVVDDNSQDVSGEILLDNVSQEYHTLRFKLFKKQNIEGEKEDKSLEPIDSSGNPVKESRFRAQMRRK